MEVRLQVDFPHLLSQLLLMGSLSNGFEVKQELRDPLSPFLFTLVLGRMISRAVERGVVKGISVGTSGVLASDFSLPGEW